MFFRKRYAVKKFSYGDIEPHEVFWDKAAKQKEEEIGVTEKKFEVPLKQGVIFSLFAIFALCASVFLFKIFFLQIINGKELRNISQNNKGALALMRPERGIIYDRNMEKLVANGPAYDFVCDKRQFAQSGPETQAKINSVALAIGKSPEELLYDFENSDDSEILAQENIAHEALLVLETKINELPYCHIKKNTARKYADGPAFSHLLGYTGRINQKELQNATGYSVNDYIGKTGLEAFYEEILRGKAGYLETQKTALGAQVGQEIVQEPVAGENLVLNIDAALQKKIYEELGKSLKNIGAKKGAAVAMNPQNGAVLALVSYPSFDNNLFTAGISKTDYNNLNNDPSQPLFNRAIQAHYPTGSTIKPFEAAAALQEDLISPTKQINDPGYILVQSRYDSSVTYRYGGVAPHGMVDMRKALAVSSNIYFYTVGGGYGDQKGLGPAKIKQYLSLFGWDKKTGIDLPGEFEGFIPDPEWKKKKKGESWWDGDTYNLSIGQSDLQTTPLQVALAYCAVANGGILYKPRIADKVMDSANKNIIREFYPEIIRSNFIDPQNLEIVREGMRDGVAEPYGLSAMLNNLPVSAAAKTGTAEIGLQNHFNVWSSVFAPYENPEIVLVVTAENVQGFGAVTLPVARNVLDWYFTK